MDGFRPTTNIGEVLGAIMQVTSYEQAREVCAAFIGTPRVVSEFGGNGYQNEEFYFVPPYDVEWEGAPSFLVRKEDGKVTKINIKNLEVATEFFDDPATEVA